MDRPIWLGYCVMSLLHPSVEFSPVPPQLLFLCVQAINKSCSMTSVHLGKGGGIFWKFRFKHGKLCSLGQWEMDFKWDWSEYTLVRHIHYTADVALATGTTSTVWADWGGESAVFPESFHNTSSSENFLVMNFLSPLKGPCYLVGYFELEIGNNTNIFRSLFSLPIT